MGGLTLPRADDDAMLNASFCPHSVHILLIYQLMTLIARLFDLPNDFASYILSLCYRPTSTLFSAYTPKIMLHTFQDDELIIKSYHALFLAFDGRFRKLIFMPSATITSSSSVKAG